MIATTIFILAFIEIFLITKFMSQRNIEKLSDLYTNFSMDEIQKIRARIFLAFFMLLFASVLLATK